MPQIIGRTRPWIGRSEGHFTIEVARFLKMRKLFFCHIANERKVDPKRGAFLKAMGVRKGMPDMLVFYPHEDDGQRYAGLAIELKKGFRAKPTEDQIRCLNALEVFGWKSYIAYNLDSIIKVIDEMIKHKQHKNK